MFQGIYILFNTHHYTSVEAFRHDANSLLGSLLRRESTWEPFFNSFPSGPSSDRSILTNVYTDKSKVS